VGPGPHYLIRDRDRALGMVFSDGFDNGHSRPTNVARSPAKCYAEWLIGSLTGSLPTCVFGERTPPTVCCLQELLE